MVLSYVKVNKINMTKPIPILYMKNNKTQGRKWVKTETPASRILTDRKLTVHIDF